MRDKHIEANIYVCELRWYHEFFVLIYDLDKELFYFVRNELKKWRDQNERF